MLLNLTKALKTSVKCNQGHQTMVINAPKAQTQFLTCHIQCDRLRLIPGP
jgi:hypothetical protein